MGCTRLVHYAAAIALLASPAVAKVRVVPKALTGADIVSNCGHEWSAGHCNGYLGALHDMAGNRYLNRACPPAISGYDDNYPRGIVLDYILAHPESKKARAVDVVFDAETAYLSRALHLDCREK